MDKPGSLIEAVHVFNYCLKGFLRVLWWGVPHGGRRNTILPNEFHYEHIVPCSDRFRYTDPCLKCPLKVPEFLVNPGLDQLAPVCCPDLESGVPLDVVLHLLEVGCGHPVDLDCNEVVGVCDALEDIGLLPGTHSTIENSKVT